MTTPNCLFCAKDNPELNKIIDENDLAYARWDNFPASLGHAQVVPKRHVESIFELTDNEVLAVHGLAVVTKRIIVERFAPAGFNIGSNVGAAAGQEIMHAHEHLLPRYEGDVLQPAGGITNVVRPAS